MESEKGRRERENRERGGKSERKGERDRDSEIKANITDFIVVTYGYSLNIQAECKPTDLYLLTRKKNTDGGKTLTQWKIFSEIGSDFEIIK